MTGLALRVLAETVPNEAPREVSRFLRQHLADRGLSALVDRILGHTGSVPIAITSEEIRRLLGAPLSLLGGIAKSCKHAGRASAPEPAHPVLYLPLAHLIEEHGVDDAVRRATALIQSVESAVRFSGVLSVAIDRWSGMTELSTLLEALRRLVGRFSVDSVSPRLQIIGPSTVEIVRICEDQRASLSEKLAEFSAGGVRRIDGGTHMPIHSAAAQLGFDTHIGQDVSFIFEALRLHPAPGHRRPGEFMRILEERFVGDLLEIGDQMFETGRLRTWFPWARTGEELRHLDPTGDFGLPFLRCVVLARILLPAETAVRAPLSLFGRLLAEVALEFGADEFGFVAVNGETARALGIHKLSEIVNADTIGARFAVAGDV